MATDSGSVLLASLFPYLFHSWGGPEIQTLGGKRDRKCLLEAALDRYNPKQTTASTSPTHTDARTQPCKHADMQAHMHAIPDILSNRGDSNSCFEASIHLYFTH